MIGRTLVMAKHHTPNSLRVAARRAMLEGHNTRMWLSVPVSARCEFANVYHCAVRKTASQWINAIFSDPIVYRHSDLLPYVPRYYSWRHPQAFPPGRVVLSLFVSRKGFNAIPKPRRHRTFFVMRDPRDIVVSDYFSTRDSHTPMGDIPEQRRILRGLPVKDGLLHMIGHLAKKGTFRSLRSWATAPADEAVRLVKYEDLTGERQAEELESVLRHCGITIPAADLETLLARYSFSNMRGRQASGAHYRKGAAGDWRNHFDDDIDSAFTEAAGDLVTRLGYPERG
ncbi:sulfotransferase domain-containing protein [Actinoplanes sp. NPDC051633]|uniref:sulfotransferase domain-containing protein n=1 Tax=Actinoplanes sp. NPDC051633 TaxID=3155670 RepID=UPI00343D4CFD